jgi:hypothetical protein
LNERFREKRSANSSWVVMIGGRSKSSVGFFCGGQLAEHVKDMQYTLLRMDLKECKSLSARSLSVCKRDRGNGRAESGGLKYRDTLESDL